MFGLLEKFLRPSTNYAAPSVDNRLYDRDAFLTSLRNNSWVTASGTETFISVVWQTLPQGHTPITRNEAFHAVSNAVGYVLREQNNHFSQPLSEESNHTEADICMASEAILKDILTKMVPAPQAYMSKMQAKPALAL